MKDAGRISMVYRVVGAVVALLILLPALALGLYVSLSVFAATGSRLAGAVAAVIVTTVAYTVVAAPVLIWLAKRATRSDAATPAR